VNFSDQNDAKFNKAGEKLPKQKPLILSKDEQGALLELKEEVRIWLQNQLGNGLLYSNDYPLIGNQRPIFKKFKIEPDRQRPLLIQALKEEIKKL